MPKSKKEKGGSSKYAKKVQARRKSKEVVPAQATAVPASEPSEKEVVVTVSPTVAEVTNGDREPSFLELLKSLATAIGEFLGVRKGFEVICGKMNTKEAVLVHDFIQECIRRLKKVQAREFVSKDLIGKALRSAERLTERFRKRIDMYVQQKIADVQVKMNWLKARAPEVYGRHSNDVMDIVASIMEVAVAVPCDYSAVATALGTLSERMGAIDGEAVEHLHEMREAEERERKRRAQEKRMDVASSIADDALAALEEAGSM